MTAAEMLASIRVGDSVTLRTPQGQNSTGKAVMRSSPIPGWVLDLGGRYGRPGVVTVDNIVAVRKRRTYERSLS